MDRNPAGVGYNAPGSDHYDFSIAAGGIGLPIFPSIGLRVDSWGSGVGVEEEDQEHAPGAARGAVLAEVEVDLDVLGVQQILREL